MDWFLPGLACRPAAGGPRSHEQWIAPVSLPAVQSERVRGREDVDRNHSVIEHNLGARAHPLPAAKLPRRLVMVLGEHSDRERDLSGQSRLDRFTRPLNADDFSLG